VKDIIQTTAIVRPAESLQELEAALRTTVGQLRKTSQTWARKAAEAGDLFNRVKKNLERGKWLAWLEERCEEFGICVRQAQNWMKAARNPKYEETSFSTLQELLADGPELDEPDSRETPRVNQSRVKGDVRDEDDGVAMSDSEEFQAEQAATDRANPDRRVIKDCNGCAVPADLEKVFREGKELYSDAKGSLLEVRDAVRASAAQPFGKALIGTLQDFEMHIKAALEDVRFAMPWALCPNLAPGGEHSESCKVCGGTRWLSRGRHEQLSPELKNRAAA
jgi:hypothetical protein